jgi:GT2 family glycosyltransferase
VGAGAPITAIVAVNYRTPKQTILAVRRCDRLLLSELVIVIDNASPDDSVHRLRRELPQATVIAAPRNDGFGAGCNLGIREALHRGAARIFLLNPDTVVQPGALEALERVFDAHPAVGIVGPLVQIADTAVVESAGVRYAPLTGRVRHLRHGRDVREHPPRRFAEVDAVSGCAMLVRREVFETAGLFEEDYFYGFEDLEFCLRARRHGFRTAVASDAVVHHAGQASIGRASPRRLYFAVRNHLRVASQVGPQAWPLVTVRAAAIVGWTTAFAVGRAGVPIGPGLRAIARGVCDYWRGRYGPDA